MTGPAPSPIAEAGGAGISRTPKGPAALPYGMDTEGPRQGPRQSGSQFFSAPEGPSPITKERRTRARKKEAARLRDIRDTRRIGYGSLAGVTGLGGLATVLNMQNEEDQNNEL